MSRGLTSIETSNIDVAVDELISRHSVNRNFATLLTNDLQLAELYDAILQNLGISPYVEGRPTPYMYNDIVWFRDANDFSALYLLRCVLDNNTHSPQEAVDSKNEYGEIDFEAYGWSDQNSYLDVLNSTIRKSLQRTLRDKIASHIADPTLHRFGDISDDPTSPDYYANKMMLKDTSNVAYPRANVFYPCMTGHFSDGPITYGIYSIWDNGILELDLNFKVGWRSENNTDADALFENIVCNDLDLSDSDDGAYFNSPSDMTIFKTNIGYTSTIGNIRQTNRNDYVNAYSAELKFPAIQYMGQIVMGFKDVNYMVFNSETMA